MIALAATDVVRVGKFGLIGVANTAIDFAIFNALSGKRVGLGKIRANIVSTTVAMSFSFFANRSYVFDGAGGNVTHQIISFVIVTVIGIYIIQNLIIYYLAGVASWPTRLIGFTMKKTGLNRHISTEFATKNAAKLVATVASLTWNYIFYGRIVFHGSR